MTALNELIIPLSALAGSLIGYVISDFLESKRTKKYVTERIANISELEKILERERLIIIWLEKGLKEETISTEDVKMAVEDILKEHNKACEFEFLIDRRKTLV